MLLTAVCGLVANWSTAQCENSTVYQALGPANLALLPRPPASSPSRSMPQLALLPSAPTVNLPSVPATAPRPWHHHTRAFTRPRTAVSSTCSLDGALLTTMEESS